MTPQLEARARLYALKILAFWGGKRMPWSDLDDWQTHFQLLRSEPPAKSSEPPDMRALIASGLGDAEEDPLAQGPPDPSVAEFSQALNFTENETSLLEFVLLVNYSPAFQSVRRADSSLTLPDVARAAYAATGIRPADSASGFKLLGDCGFLDEGHGITNDLEDHLRLAFDLTGLLDDSTQSAQTIINTLVERAPESTLTVDDFDYMEDDAMVVANILLRAMQERTKGVSILLYGDPGVGKSEFARLVIENALGEAFIPRTGRVSHHRPRDEQRTSGLRVAQRILRNRKRAVLIVDEAEDLLSDTVSWRTRLFGGNPSMSKMDMTQLLECAPVPTIWIANDPEYADPALLRRFTYAIRFEAPPRVVRRRIIAEQFTSIPVSPEWLDSRASERRLPQGVTALAARAVRMSGSVVEAEAVADRALSSVRDLLNLPDPANDAVGPAVYDLEFLNTELDLPTLIETIGQRGEGRICLYGPPGTGKSAFALHLARSIGLDVLRKSAADLISCWLGETEKNIKGMFREGRRYGDVILLDEADSFLRDRQHAQRSWEVSQVNELLMQMENHTGIFICTTNLKETLDAASLRRFDLKIHCDWLRPAQAVGLAERHLVALGLAWPSDAHATEALKARLRRIANLAPGDYAAVLRGQRLLGGLRDAGQLVSLLEEECAAKPGAPKAQGVGFV